MTVAFAIIVAVVGLLIFAVISDSKRQAEASAKRLADHLAKKARDDEIENLVAAWKKAQSIDGWQFVCEAKIMHISGYPECFFMMSDNGLLLKMNEFERNVPLVVKENAYLNINQIISINTARPKITKSRKTSVPVSIVESKNKSPVARGLIGGAILGPAGIVIGAASGLNSKTTTRIENRDSYESYETQGDPQLIMGTTSPELPVLKLKFSAPELADEWMFRIRGLQARKVPK